MLSLSNSYILTKLVVWGVDTSDEASDFTVEFSTDGGVSYESNAETVATTDHLGTSSAALAFVPPGRRADTVRLTITNNAKWAWFRRSGGRPRGRAR